MTKEEVSAYNSSYHTAHREEAIIRNKKWRETHRTEVSVYMERAGKKLKHDWYMRNRDRSLIKSPNYRKKNETRLKSLAAARFQLVKKEVWKLRKKKMAIDLHFRLAVLLRSRLGTAIRRNYKAGSAVRDLGCTIPELKFYLEGQFQDGMTWENWSRTGWHIDHEIPLAFFDLTNREQFLRACHYTNLQPMWAEENLRKNKYLNSVNI